MFEPWLTVWAIRNLVLEEMEQLGWLFIRGGRVHFGYRDGIGQPTVNWTNSTSATADSNQVHYRTSCLDIQMSMCPHTERRIGAALAKDSTYMVFRWSIKT